MGKFRVAVKIWVPQDGTYNTREKAEAKATELLWKLKLNRSEVKVEEVKT